MADRIERMVLKFRDVLAATERLEPDDLATYQQNLLVPLVKHARGQVPFYRNRLKPLFHGEEVDITEWRKVPILTRAEAQRNARALAARQMPPHAGKVEEEETSGSTGRPFKHLRNELVEVAMLAATDRALRWWDFDGNKSMASFVSRRRQLAPPPDGAIVRGWRIGSSGLHYVLDMWADTDFQIDWLLARRPHYLTAYSSALLALAERAKIRGADLRFERIASTATAMSDEIRAACRDVFGAEPIDQYGAQEVGLIACECPSCRRYHVNGETVMVEIVNEDGMPCHPGDTGRVILTSLYNYAMPFIRYEIGDYATVGAAESDCPIRLPTLSRILGRYRNTFTLSDGRILYPYVAIGRFRDFISFDQVQVVQTDYDKIEVRYVPLDDGDEADERGLEIYLRDAIDSSFKVRAVVVQRIPRAASGKFEDFLSLVSRHRS